MRTVSLWGKWSKVPPNLGSDLRSLYNRGGHGAGWPPSVKESIVRQEGLVLRHFLPGRAGEQGEPEWLWNSLCGRENIQLETDTALTQQYYYFLHYYCRAEGTLSAVHESLSSFQTRPSNKCYDHMCFSLMHLCNTAEFRIRCTSCVSFPPSMNCRFSAVIVIDTGALFPVRKAFWAHFYLDVWAE